MWRNFVGGVVVIEGFVAFPAGNGGLSGCMIYTSFRAPQGACGAEVEDEYTETVYARS
jgi:hypothetical protein